MSDPDGNDLAAASLTRVTDAVIVGVRGEIDGYSAPILDHAVDQTLTSAPRGS